MQHLSGIDWQGKTMTYGLAVGAAGAVILCANAAGRIWRPLDNIICGVTIGASLLYIAYPKIKSLLNRINLARKGNDDRVAAAAAKANLVPSAASTSAKASDSVNSETEKNKKSANAAVARSEDVFSYGGLQIRQGPLDLYHGLNFGGFNSLISIINTGYVYPQIHDKNPEGSKELLEKGDLKGSKHNRFPMVVYQHYLAHHPCSNTWGGSSLVDFVAYIDSQKEVDPKFYAKVSCSWQYTWGRKFTESFDACPAERNGGCGYVTWLSKEIDSRYGDKYAIHFRFTTEQIQELEKDNEGGVSVYKLDNYYISQPVPLKYAKEIVVNPEYNKEAKAKAEIEQIKKLLEANPELKHIKVVVR